MIINLEIKSNSGEKVKDERKLRLLKSLGSLQKLFVIGKVEKHNHKMEICLLFAKN